MESSSRQAKPEPESFEDKVKKRKSSRISANAQTPAQTDESLPSQLRSFGDPGETAKSIATLEAIHTKPASKTTFLPSLPSSSQTFSKNKLEKLASETSKPVIDDELDADVSETGTESDLESLIGDDEIPTHPNPEEDDYTHESLREQLRGIEIRKRRHDEVNQEFDNRSASELLTPSRDASTREPNLVVQALTPARGMQLVKKEDEEEERRGKRVKSGTGCVRWKGDDV